MSSVYLDRVKELLACGDRQTRAARMLAMSGATLVQTIRLYGLPRPRKSS